MEKKKSLNNSLKGTKRNITVHEMDLSQCGKYQELDGSWVIWMLISGIILCFKNLYGGVTLIFISLIIFILYRRSSKNISATHYNLALEYIGKNDMDKAKEALCNSIKFNPENKVAYVLLSSIYYKQSDYKRTIENLLSSKVLEVPNSKYNYLVGACYFNMNDYKNAIKYLKKVKYEDKDPMECVRDVLLGKAYFLNEEYKQALKVFNKVGNIDKKLKGNLIEFNYFLGMTYLKVGEKDKAKKELFKVYEEDKEYRDINKLMNEIK